MEELSEFATHRTLKLILVLGHSYIGGYEEVYELGEPDESTNTTHLISEPVLGIPICLIKTKPKNWKANEVLHSLG